MSNNEEISDYKSHEIKRKTKTKPKSKKSQSKINLTRNFNTYFSVKLKVEKGNVSTNQLIKD